MKILPYNLAPLVAFIVLAVGVRHAHGTVPAPDESTGKKSVQLVDVTAAKRLISTRPVTILDVRTPEEFNAGHIAGAKNLNFSDADFQTKLQQLEKGRTYLVHCASGRRSAQAVAVMSRLGFKSVYDLAGGIKAWEEAKQEVIK